MFEASLIIKRHKPMIIAITGSVGKTTTKDILYAGLQDHFNTRTAQKSFNSDIGVPLSIMDLQNPSTSLLQWLVVLTRGVWIIISGKEYPELLILEVGAGAPNDVRKIAKWLKPDISVFTKLAETPVHIEFFESKEQLYNEKKTLATYTKPEGLVLYNGDSKRLAELLKDISQRTKTFSLPDSISFNTSGTGFVYEGKPVTLPEVLGFQMVYPVMALIEIYKELGVDVSVGLETLQENYEPTPGRARLIQGIDKTTIIDDAYNASPVAVKAALEVLGKLETNNRKVFVFGDMMELGDHAIEEHILVAKLAESVVDEVITVGELSKETDNYLENTETKNIHFDTSVEAGEYLVDSHMEGDVILFKASRHAIKMEQAIVQMALPEEHGKLVQEYL